MTSNQKTPAGAALDLTADQAYAAANDYFRQEGGAVMAAGGTLAECSRALKEAGRQGAVP